MPEGKVFIDTNILVYAYDNTAGSKYDIARGIIVDLWDSRQGIVSTQVLQEFFVTVTSKIPKPVDIKTGQLIVKDLLKWEVVVNSGEGILDAVEILIKYKYSFWDSLIISAAVNSGAGTLLSEDLSHGQIVDGLEIKNPFI